MPAERVETTDVIEAPAEVEGDQLPPGDDLTPLRLLNRQH